MTTTESIASRQDVGIQRIGDYLLKGWVLTDQGCSRCNIPTMRTKDRQTVGFCVLCDDKLNPMPLFSPQSAPEEEEEDLDELLASVDPIKSTIPKVDVSALLGQKLLQGWTMMEDICPRDICVGVDRLNNADL